MDFTVNQSLGDGIEDDAHRDQIAYDTQPVAQEGQTLALTEPKGVEIGWAGIAGIRDTAAATEQNRNQGLDDKAQTSRAAEPLWQIGEEFL